MPYNMEDDVNRTGNHYNCPVVASYAENIRNNMDVLRNENIEFIEPFLPINNPKKMLQRLTEVEFFKSDGITSKELKAAMDAGYKELEQYREDVRNKGKEILQIAKEKISP